MTCNSNSSPPLPRCLTKYLQRESWVNSCGNELCAQYFLQLFFFLYLPVLFASDSKFPMGRGCALFPLYFVFKSLALAGHPVVIIKFERQNLGWSLSHTLMSFLVNWKELHDPCLSSPGKRFETLRVERLNRLAERSCRSEGFSALAN